jgi:hypothetical protein
MIDQFSASARAAVSMSMVVLAYVPSEPGLREKEESVTTLGNLPIAAANRLNGDRALADGSRMT